MNPLRIFFQLSMNPQISIVNTISPAGMIRPRASVIDPVMNLLYKQKIKINNPIEITSEATYILISVSRLYVLIILFSPCRRNGETSFIFFVLSASSIIYF